MQAADPWFDAPTRPVRLGATACEVERKLDGSIRMRLKEPLGDYPRRYTDRLVHWASTTPNQVFLARRPPGGPAVGTWEALSYQQTLEQVRAIAQSLLRRELSRDRPVVILSENDFENQLLALACTHVGIPYVPVTPAYSLMSKDYAKLKFLNERVRPGLAFASNGAQYEAAAKAAFPQAEFVATRTEGSTATPFATLLACTPGPAVDAAFESIQPEDVAKLLFTSGTTGEPKGVQLTHRMLCSNRQQLVQALPFCADAPPVLVDWLPWHHTFGGTNNVGLALYCGGSYYIDPGKPMAEAVQPTIDALREISPTIYYNTPAGLAALLPHLQRDQAFRDRFFARLQLIYYGGAVLPVHTWAGLDEVAVKHSGERVLMVSGLGSTECGPVPATTYSDPRREAMVGLPVPGVEFKITPINDKLELRLRGDCVTPGYWNDPAMTAAAFDEEGFFRLGDAVTFVDAEHPERGLRFDGRIAENFKLSSGTWVHSGTLRTAAVAAFSPLVLDVVIAGSGQDFVGALVFPDIAACRALDAQLPANADARAVLASTIVRARFQRMLDELAAKGTGSANRVVRAIVLTEPATLDNGEMTPKATVSAATVLRRRGQEVAELFAPEPGAQVLRAG
ncbi:MAG TPA: feruloyl-CoA synthase [Steroidobacteraceae bacterium]|nr:feruloyl-CoA synthase [Steroidobacteraceae bacterium]